MMDSKRQAGQRTTRQGGGGQGAMQDKRVADDVRQVTRGDPDDTTRGRGWGTWDDAKGGGNSNDDEEEEKYNTCGGNDDVTIATSINPLCTTQQPTNNWMP
jgi:hypothetical protein